jgi:hypothetical protein
MKDQMDVSALSRRVMWPVGATPIHSVTEWPSLLPSSSRTPVGTPYGALSLWEAYGVPMFRLSHVRMGEARSVHR